MCFRLASALVFAGPYCVGECFVSSQADIDRCVLLLIASDIEDVYVFG